MPKSVPQVCPLGAPQENSTTAFAYTRTVVWAYANGCLGIRKRLFGRTQTVITLCQTPCNSVPFSCFRDTYFFKKGLWGAPRGHLRGTLLGLECPLQRAYSQRVRPKRGTGGTLFFVLFGGIEIEVYMARASIVVECRHDGGLTLTEQV